MGLLSRLFGRRRAEYDDHRHDDGYGYDPGYEYDQRPTRPSTPRSADDQAVERYRYLLRTAPPDQIEEAHAEAFAQLTPEQRRQVLGQLSEGVPASERPRSDDPRTLARAATRAELRQPGFMERTFGGYGQPGHGPAYGPGYGPAHGGGYGRGGGFGGMGMGGMIGGSMLGTIGGLVVGTAVADALFDTGLGDGGLFGGGDEEAYAAGYEDGAGGDGGDYGGDPGGDFAGGADNGWGGDSGSGDFGGGDFGGGDFGGGDF